MKTYAYLIILGIFLSVITYAGEKRKEVIRLKNNLQQVEDSNKRLLKKNSDLAETVVTAEQVRSIFAEMDANYKQVLNANRTALSQSLERTKDDAPEFYECLSVQLPSAVSSQLYDSE